MCGRFLYSWSSMSPCFEEVKFHDWVFKWESDFGGVIVVFFFVFFFFLFRGFVVVLLVLVVCSVLSLMNSLYIYIHPKQYHKN